MYWFNRKKRIYLDYAATTPVDPRVAKAMIPFGRSHFGNPGSIHNEGVIAAASLLKARTKIARSLKVRTEEIIFTSGGTEANNLAIRGVVEAARSLGRDYRDMHIITSVVEHASVLECVRALERDGVSVTYLGVDEEGFIDPESVQKALRPTTLLVSLMYVNNEIGTITSLRKISEHIRFYRSKQEKGKESYPLFHTDASQAPLYLDCSPERLLVDLLTVDAQKIYGPKGIGFLFKRHGVPLAPIFYGGGQEYGLRPGTEPIALIFGLAEAFVIATKSLKETSRRITILRDFFITYLNEKVPQAEINGSLKDRIANNVNISISGVDSEFLVIKLDQRGIAAGVASACLSKNDEGSYVVAALGKGEKYAKSTVRFSLGKETTKRDIKLAILALSECLKV